MVGHEHVGVNRAFVAGRRIAQPIEVGAIVVVFEKDGFAAMTALDDVDRDVGEKESGFPWHGPAPLF